MDNTEEFRSIELCAGYGGIHLGLKRVIKNLRTVAFVEIEAFACANLVAKMEGGLVEAAPIWTDLKTFNAKSFRDRIHFITGGYPCQPFSAAGKRLGADDQRHLWPHIRKIVKTVKPIFCFFENVEGHLSLGFKEVQQSLRDLGYAVESGIFSASECGAPQQRKRLFILAYRQHWKNNRERGIDEPRRNPLGWTPKTAQCINRETSSDGIDGRCQELGNSESNDQRRDTISAMHRERISPRGSSWPSRPGQPQHEWEPPRVVGNTTNDNGRCGEWGQEEGIRKDEIRRRGYSESSEILADTNSRMRSEQPRTNKRTIQGSNDKSRGAGRQAESKVGRNSDGLAYRLDNAELYESCDNRTDELRLCGNGVMPDVAEKAFRVLLQKLNGGL